MPQKKKTKKGVNTKNFILNCEPSVGTENDWTYEDAIAFDAVHLLPIVPSSKDLRSSWWEINDQKSIGACVGFATAYGVLRWHYYKAGKITKDGLM